MMTINSNATMSLRKGCKVWIEDRDTAWIAAEVTAFAGKQVQVVTESGKQVMIFLMLIVCLCCFCILFVNLGDLTCSLSYIIERNVYLLMID